VTLSTAIFGFAPAQEIIPQAPLLLHWLVIRAGFVPLSRTAIPLHGLLLQVLAIASPPAPSSNIIPEWLFSVQRLLLSEAVVF